MTAAWTEGAVPPAKELVLNCAVASVIGTGSGAGKLVERTNELLPAPSGAYWPPQTPLIVLPDGTGESISVAPAGPVGPAWPWSPCSPRGPVSFERVLLEKSDTVRLLFL